MCFASRLEKRIRGYVVDPPVDSVICFSLCFSTISVVCGHRFTERAFGLSFVDDLVWVPFV